MRLRELASASDITIGACASIGDLEDDRYRRLLGDEFNLLALENDLKWGRVHPEKEMYDFEAADSLVAFAEEHDMDVTGHALLWHIQNPAWLENGSFTADGLEEVLRSHISRVVDRYSDRIQTWDVVNEAVDDDGGLRDHRWYNTLGEAGIAKAFRWAAEKTDAALFYNDYGLPYNQAKQDRVYDLLDDLLDQGVPVDGVGLQLHCVGIQPDPDQVRSTIERFQELGLTVRISELDVAYSQDDAPDDVEQAQAAYYRDLLRTCLDTGVDSITFWGVLDDHSWITHWRDYPDRYTQHPLLFTGDGEPKESYRAVSDVLQEQ